MSALPIPPHIDPDWAEDQLTRSGYTRDDITRAYIDSLIYAFNVLRDKGTAINAANIFIKLANGHAIAPRDVMTTHGVWEPFELGNITSGATVRVRLDAYDGPAGEHHNGKVGTLAAARGGRAIVQYADGQGTGNYHYPDKLEVMVTKQIG